MRSRFDELRDYLKANLGLLRAKKEQFDSTVENATGEPGGLNCTEKGYHVMNLRYRGVIWIERLPRPALELLMIMTAMWLAQNDDTRQNHALGGPEYDFIDLGGGLQDVEIAIDFVDDFYIAAADDGPVDWEGQKFAPVDFDLWTAESAEVGHEGT